MFLGLPIWYWRAFALLCVLGLIFGDSEGIPRYSNGEIASIARDTYGWNCPSVSEVSSESDGYYAVRCSNGLRLRVYPRVGTYPRITNSSGGYN